MDNLWISALVQWVRRANPSNGLDDPSNPLDDSAAWYKDVKEIEKKVGPSRHFSLETERNERARDIFLTDYIPRGMIAPEQKGDIEIMNKMGAAAIAACILNAFFIFNIHQNTKTDASKVRCQEQPQWTTKGEKGEDVGIYVCFGPRSQLLYTVRVIPPVAQALAAFQAENQKLRDELNKALKSKKPQAPKTTSPLPTISGTAAQP